MRKNTQFKKGSSPWNKGKTGYKTKPASEETKKKIGDAQRGIPRFYARVKRPKSVIEKISNSKKKSYANGTSKKIWLGKKGKESSAYKHGMTSNMVEYRKWYLKNNRESIYFINMKRRLMKLGIQGSHTLSEWQTLKAQYNWTCPSCKKSEPDIFLSKDHIIPISKGGSDNIENIQPLCRSCNSSKNDKIIPKYNV